MQDRGAGELKNLSPLLRRSDPSLPWNIVPFAEAVNVHPAPFVLESDPGRVFQDDDAFSGDARCLMEEHARVLRVVKDKNEARDVDGLVAVGQTDAIKERKVRDPNRWRYDVAAVSFALKIAGNDLEQVAGAATNVEDLCSRAEIVFYMFEGGARFGAAFPAEQLVPGLQPVF